VAKVGNRPLECVAHAGGFRRVQVQCPGDIFSQWQSGLVQVKQVGHGASQTRQTNLREENGVEVRAEQFLVQQIKTRRHNLPSHEVRLIIEVMAVVI
jgi:hypothetical protein